MLENYVLHLTKKCNMKCTYCYEEDKTSEFTWDEIKLTIDNIVKYNKHFNIDFLGGEPCLEMDHIVKTVEYLENMDDVRVELFILTTNGTIINQELIDLLINHKNVVWYVSLDGNKFMNFMRLMKNNVNSYDTVMDNFHTLRGILGDDTKQLGAHMVTHPYNIGSYVEGISDLYDKGFRSIDIGIVESTITIDNMYCQEFLRQNRLLSDKIRNGEFVGLRIGMFNCPPNGADKRHYIEDKSGKLLLETYGRCGEDIKDSVEYKTEPSTSPLGTLIHDLKKEAYDYHNR